MRIRDTAGGRVRGPFVGAGGRMYPAGGWPAAGCIRPAAGYPSCPDARLGHQRSAMDWSKKETVENRRKTPQRHRARAQGPVATDAEGSGSARTRIAAAMCNRLNSFPMRPRPAAAGAGPTASCGCGCHGAGPLVWRRPRTRCLLRYQNRAVSVSGWPLRLVWLRRRARRTPRQRGRCSSREGRAVVGW